MKPFPIRCLFEVSFLHATWAVNLFFYSFCWLKHSSMPKRCVYIFKRTPRREIQIKSLRRRLEGNCLHNFQMSLPLVSESKAVVESWKAIFLDINQNHGLIESLCFLEIPFLWSLKFMKRKNWNKKLYNFPEVCVEFIGKISRDFLEGKKNLIWNLVKS